MKFIRLFSLLVFASSMQACFTTRIEIPKRQWENCEKLCAGKLAGAGIELFGTEKTCLCENQVRFRYEGTKVAPAEDEGDE